MLTVKALVVATPSKPVIAVIAFVPVLLKTPLGPDSGAVKVTVTHGTPAPDTSVITAARFCSATAPKVIIWGEPFKMEIVDGVVLG